MNGPGWGVWGAGRGSVVPRAREEPVLSAAKESPYVEAIPRALSLPQDDESVDRRAPRP